MRRARQFSSRFERVVGESCLILRYFIPVVSKPVKIVTAVLPLLLPGDSVIVWHHHWLDGAKRWQWFPPVPVTVLRRRSLAVASTAAILGVQSNLFEAKKTPKTQGCSPANAAQVLHKGIRTRRRGGGEGAHVRPRGGGALCILTPPLRASSSLAPSPQLSGNLRSEAHPRARPNGP
jgi:hypothetical protein